MLSESRLAVLECCWQIVPDYDCRLSYIQQVVIMFTQHIVTFGGNQ